MFILPLRVLLVWRLNVVGTFRWGGSRWGRRWRRRQAQECSCLGWAILAPGTRWLRGCTRRARSTCARSRTAWPPRPGWGCCWPWCSRRECWARGGMWPRRRSGVRSPCTRPRSSTSCLLCAAPASPWPAPAPRTSASRTRIRRSTSPGSGGSAVSAATLCAPPAGRQAAWSCSTSSPRTRSFVCSSRNTALAPCSLQSSGSSVRNYDSCRSVLS